MLREIVRIDENKCDGCGLCVPACAEGAIKIIDGKARLIADNLCDGLGACLGHCPKDAIIIEKRNADAFDEVAVEEHLHKDGGAPAGHGHGHHHGGGCPSAQVKSFTPPTGHGGGCPSAALRSFDAEKAATPTNEEGQRPTELRQWPVQMHLIPPTAPFLKGADVVFAADCVPFAYADFHKDFLKGKALLIGCPKLDDGQAYLEKLTAMLQQNDIKSLTILHMEVPCCSGLIAIARQALAASGKEIPFETIKIGIQGDRK
ncbi:MAG: ferredoxin [Desulfuromonas sp.]|nr:MAG: ferredoxin [Desulfuromonas sp.]